MRTSLAKNYPTNFVLDEGKLRKLVEALNAHAVGKSKESELEIKVTRADDSEYVVDTVDAVLDDNNATKKHIQKLEITLSRKPRYPSTFESTVTFDRSPPSYRYYPVSYSIKEESKAEAFVLAEELDTQIQRTLTSPKRTESDSFDPLAAVALAIIVILGLGRAFPTISHTHLADLTLLRFVLFIGVILGIFVVAIVVVVGVGPSARIANLISSESVFYWGDQKEAYDAKRGFRQNMKWVVVIGFLVSAAAGVIVALLLSK